MDTRFRFFILTCLLTVTMNASSLDTFSTVTSGPMEREKRSELWVTAVLSIAKQIRTLEENYETFSRQCVAAQGTREEKSAEEAGRNKTAVDPACVDAQKALRASQVSRKEYVNLLSRAERASISVPWLKAHFTWVRWGKEWAN